MAIVILFFSYTFAQKEKIEIEGAIVLADSDNEMPKKGTIRFNPSLHDFEGWDGTQWKSLTRLTEPGGGVTDNEGNFYRTIKLGHQEWMAENLHTDKYNDGTSIPQITSNVDWSALMSGAWSYYDNDPNNEDPYGKLYNWYAIETNKLCPVGWHVPDVDEWDNLMYYLGGLPVAGGKIKEAGNGHWLAPNTGATNISDFTALPHGFRFSSGQFFHLSKSAGFWSQTEDGLNDAFRFVAEYDDANINRGALPKVLGLAVRCIRD